MLNNIKRTFSPAPSMICQAAQGTQVRHSVLVTGILAFLVGFGAILAESVAIIPAVIIQWLTTGEMNMESSDLTMVIAKLYVTAVPIILLLLYVKYVEKRSFGSMGFVRKRAVTDYLVGMLIAFAMFTVCVVVCVWNGAMVFCGYVLDGRYLMLAVMFLGYVIQGASEEIVMRGFMMTSFGSKGGALAGVFFNSLIFGALHLPNKGITVLSVTNCVLFGIFMSLLVLKQNAIWMACGIHTVWNFAEGCFYGILVSGKDSGLSVFRFDSVRNMEFLNGGSFGMEGGTVTLVVLVAAILIVLLLRPREQEAQAVAE